MKKVTFLLATLLIGGMMLTGCKKDDPNSGSGETPDTPTTTTKTVVYKMDNTLTSEGVTYTVSPCFHYTFSYKDADGNMVEVNDPTLPWSKEITVTAPFEAQLKGTVSYNESDLPSPVYFGRLGSISQGSTHTIPEAVNFFNDKDRFIDFITPRPEKLEYNFTLSIE